MAAIEVLSIIFGILLGGTTGLCIYLAYHNHKLNDRIHEQHMLTTDIIFRMARENAIVAKAETPEQVVAAKAQLDVSDLQVRQFEQDILGVEQPFEPEIEEQEEHGTLRFTGPDNIEHTLDPV